MKNSMSSLFFCPECEHGYRIPNTDPDRHLLSITMPCPTQGCDSRVEYCDPKELKKSQTMSARILYEACMGRGFPHERKCSPEHLVMLMVGGEVTDISLCSAGENRSLIESLTVRKNDVEHKIHFAMSVKGATIYKTEQIDG